MVKFGHWFCLGLWWSIFWGKSLHIKKPKHILHNTRLGMFLSSDHFIYKANVNTSSTSHFTLWHQTNNNQEYKMVSFMKVNRNFNYKTFQESPKINSLRVLKITPCPNMMTWQKITTISYLINILQHFGPLTLNLKILLDNIWVFL